MDKEVKFSLKIGVIDMYRFMILHAYRGIGGIANMVISGGALALFLAGVGKGDTFSRGMLIFIAALFTIINPIYILYKAAKQVKLSPMFQKPLHYTINSSGILVKQEADELLMPWEEIRKVSETKKDIYIYLSLTRAYIFPKIAYADDIGTFKELIKQYTNAKLK